METLETVKLKAPNEFGFDYKIINLSDFNESEGMELYIEPSDDSEPEEKPVATPAKKRTAAKA